MVELVDTQVSGTCGIKPVGVQIPLSALFFIDFPIFFYYYGL